MACSVKDDQRAKVNMLGDQAAVTDRLLVDTVVHPFHPGSDDKRVLSVRHTLLCQNTSKTKKLSLVCKSFTRVFTQMKEIFLHLLLFPLYFSLFLTSTVVL